MHQFVFALLFAISLPLSAANAKNIFAGPGEVRYDPNNPNSLQSQLFCLQNPKRCSGSILLPANRPALAGTAAKTARVGTAWPEPATRQAKLATRLLSQSSAPPVAFQIFCLRYPEDCKPSQASLVAFSEANLWKLSVVNNAVNSAITPRRESRDVWSLAPKAGDCDDYVMTKRHRLIGAGMPASALRASVVRTRSGEAHAVLVVATTAGELVLDNLRERIVKRSATGYVTVATATADPNVWTD